MTHMMYECMFLYTYLVVSLQVASPHFTSLLPSLVASCCYKMLESPSVMKEKAVKEELFQLLGLLVKKYNQTLSE